VSKKEETMAERFVALNQKLQMGMLSSSPLPYSTTAEIPNFHPYIREMSTSDIISVLKSTDLIKVLNREIYISSNTSYHSFNKNEFNTIIEKIIHESSKDESTDSLNTIIDAVIKDPQFRVGYHCPVDREPTTDEQNRQTVWNFIEQTYEWGTQDDIVLSADAYSCYQATNGLLSKAVFVRHFSSLAKLHFQAVPLSHHIAGVRGMRNNAASRQQYL